MMKMKENFLSHPKKGNQLNSIGYVLHNVAKKW